MLANCFVKRNDVTKSLVLPATTANDLPEGLTMRALVRRGDDDELSRVF